MGSLNRWMGIGNLGAEPELKYSGAGKAICSLRLACNETWKDKSGEKKERVEWVRVSVFNELAETCSKYLSKGRQVYVEGRLQTRSYDKDGQKHYATEVVADRVVFLGSNEGSRTAPGRTQQKPAPDQDPHNGAETGEFDDGLPF